MTFQLRVPEAKSRRLCDATKLLKIEELLTPVSCKTDSLCHLTEHVLDEFVELIFALNDDRCHCPLEVFPDLLNWIEMR